MTCPACALAAEVEDRVCRRCKRFLDAPGRLDVRLRRGRRAPLAVLARRWFQDLPPALRPAVGLVPGLAHLLGGQERRGRAYGLAVAGLVALAALGLATRLLLGIAASLHAMSLAELLPAARRASPGVRALLLVGLNLFLFAVLYHPLLSLLVPRLWNGGARGVVLAGQIESVLWLLAAAPLFLLLHRFTARLARRGEAG